MTKILYLDCFSGISGDMLLGALLDAGADADKLRAALDTLWLTGEFSLEVQKRASHGIMATDAHVRVHEHGHKHDHGHHHGRMLPDILKIIDDSGITLRAKQTARAVFEKLAFAEAEVHGVSVEEVHFHEVGAVDSIVDIVGTAVLLDILDISSICVGAVRVGSGTVRCAHGELCVPAPATARLLQGFEIYAGDEPGEFTTPTGAAVLAALCENSGPMPRMRVLKSAFGLGKRECKRINALRAIVGEAAGQAEKDWAEEEIIEIRANIDDMTGEALGFAMDRLFEAGAVDVSHTPIVMKQGRPAVMLTALCAADKLDAAIRALFKHTTSLGARYETLQRAARPREIREVQTPYGIVRVKYSGGHAHPEYCDCARLAVEHGVSLEEIHKGL